VTALRTFSAFSLVAVLVLASYAKAAPSSESAGLVSRWNASGPASGLPAQPRPVPADEPDLRAFGATGDGRADDSKAFGRWWDAVLAVGHGHIPAGKYRVAAGNLDLAAGARTGVRVSGDGAQRSILLPQGGGIRLVCSSRDAFFSKFEDFGVRAATPGPAFALGRADLSDALNSFVLDSIVVNNDDPTDNAVGLESNGVYASDFRNVVVNNAGHGVAIKFRQTQFVRFQGAAGHAGVGILLTQGYNFGDVFAGVDLETLDVDVRIESAASRHNVFLGGQYVWNVAAVDAVAGNGNVFVEPNFATGPASAAFKGAVGTEIVSH
jgi:hypothetical protein